ncbi:MAG: glycine betaine ABC transporter substrate-binding protein [Clostridiales bacterium]|nr:glycine betaine ABC transporter substrate-binding protein [Clostridiales bacterium]MCF8022705.1 glycine betaine ABC transporter substrate-binding protein [Clostridiales bacterium]
MKNHLRIISITSILLVLGLLMFGCANTDNQENNEGADDKEKGSIKLGYVEWESEVASTNILAEVLRQEGYNVEMTGVDAGVLWTGVANGGIDAMCSAWLPATQSSYNEKYKEDVVNLGPNIKGCKIGLVVPEYCTIDSIKDMNDVKDKFESTITGIESGAGVMQNTEEAIEKYNLDYELQASSSAAMAASLKKAVDNEEWTVVTGWTPHWKWAKFDLKYLKDPKNVYGASEHVSTIVREGLEGDMPKAYKILDNFNWKTENMQNVMLNIHEGTSPSEAAKKWINNHQEMVSEWTNVE